MYMYIEHQHPPPPRDLLELSLYESVINKLRTYSHLDALKIPVVITLYRYFIDFNVGNYDVYHR